jgi:hypothetical protein
MVAFLKELYRTFIFHAVAAHFVNGLLPVALLFLLLSDTTGDPSFEQTVIHLVVVALCVIPLSLLSGIRDWRIKFHGGKAPIFYRKITLAITLLCLCLAAVAIRQGRPDIAAGNDAFAWLYRGCLAAMLPVVVLLGHYGAKLASMVRQSNTQRSAD